MTISRGEWDRTGDMVTWGDEEVRGKGTVDTAGNQWNCLFWSKNDQVSGEASKGKAKTSEQVPNPKRGVGMNLKLTKGCAEFRLTSVAERTTDVHQHLMDPSPAYTGTISNAGS
jgi:hypothetical protein